MYLKKVAKERLSPDRLSKFLFLALTSLRRCDLADSFLFSLQTLTYK
jgi:hypothetical protein